VSEIQKWLELINLEIKEVVGCTEPACIALSVARAVIELEEAGIEANPAELKVELEISRDVYRNASTVNVPAVKKKGIAAAAAAGLLADSPELNLFLEFNKEDVRQINQLIKSPDWLVAKELERHGVFVRTTVRSGDNWAVVEVAEEHDNVEKVVLNGEVVDTSPRCQRAVIENLEQVREIVWLDDGQLQAVVRDYICKQGEVAELLEVDSEPMACQVEALILQRMAGESLPIQTLTGSGNQGIFVALPLYRRYKEEGKSFLVTALFTVLAQIYFTQRQQRISDTCGLTDKSALSLLAGYLYEKGCSIDKIQAAVDVLREALRGLRCDGAKESCALKGYVAMQAVERMASESALNIYLSEKSI